MVLTLAALCALVVVPLRGAAHVGPRHAVAAFLPPQAPAPSATLSPANGAQSPSEDAAYLRAPVAIDGVLEARNGGLPLPGQALAAAAASPSPGGGTPPAQTVAAPPGAPATAPTPTPAPAAGSTPGPAGSPTPAPDSAPVPGDTPENPNAGLVAAATPDAGAVGTPSPASASAPSAPLYYDHVVKSGDTVSVIAARYGISSATVIENNPLISNKNALFIGQTLRVPTTDGILYDVHLGDTVGDIADQYSVKSDAVISLAANGLANADQVREGQTILVVGAKPPTPSPTPSPSPTPPPTAAPSASPTPPPTQAPAQPPAQAPPPQLRPPPPPVPTPKPSAPASSSGYVWPAHGPITQGFGLTDFASGGAYGGAGHPGIDIGQAYGLPIVAAKDGVVTFAGGNPCCSYGYYVDISHGGGLSTRYGHMRAWPSVSIGQHVAQGQLIGYSGSTGYSTGPHVHFEFDLNGIPQNPLNYLPPGGN